MALRFATWAQCSVGAALLGACTLAAGSELLSDRMNSAVLARSIDFTVYLPDGYAASAVQYPVIYLLHGAGGTEKNWTNDGGALETLDALTRRRQLRPSITVMPSAGPDSWWIDGAADKVDTAVMTELIPFIEQKYRALPERSGRIVAGASMGGYGALSLALRHPDKFCAAGIISAAAYDPEPPPQSSARKSAQFKRKGQFSADLWKASNYPAQLGHYAQAPNKVSMWIVSGDHDHLGTAVVSANIFWQLFKIQPTQVELRIVDGDHEALTFREALPDALKYADRECTKQP